MGGHFYRGRIVINEMINILLALRLWGKDLLRDEKVTVWCDNSAVVVMTRNRTREVGLSAILRDILMIQAKCNIQLEVKHV